MGLTKTEFSQPWLFLGPGAGIPVGLRVGLMVSLRFLHVGAVLRTRTETNQNPTRLGTGTRPVLPQAIQAL
jgi:hypothetical protein